MKIKVDGNIMEGTPSEILNQLRHKAWDADEYKTTEEYLAALAATYQRMCDKELQLPDGDLDTKCAAALQALDEIKLITIEEDTTDEK